MEKQTTQELLLKIQELENKLKTLQKTKKYWLVFEEKPEIFEENSNRYSELINEFHYFLVWLELSFEAKL